MVLDFIFFDLIGEFAFVCYIFSFYFPTDYKLKIMNQNNVRTFYGKSNAQNMFKYMWLSVATTVLASSAAIEIDVVILPPEDDQLSEKQIYGNNHTLLANAAVQIEVHKYNNINVEDNQDIFDNNDL